MEMTEDAFERHWSVVRAALPRSAEQHWVAADAMVEAHRALRARVAALELRELRAASATLEIEKSRDAAAQRVAELEALAYVGTSNRPGLTWQTLSDEWRERAAKLDARVAELETYTAKLDDLQATTLRERNAAEHRAAELNRDLTAERRHRETVAANVVTWQQRSIDHEARAAKLQAEVADLTASVACLKDKRLEAEEDSIQLLAEVERLTGRAMRAEEALRKVDAAHEELVASSAAMELGLRKALSESKLDVGQVTADRDALRYSNTLLRERRDELQAEVERLTQAFARMEQACKDGEAALGRMQARAEDAEAALAEPERKRAELLDKFEGFLAKHHPR